MIIHKVVLHLNILKKSLQKGIIKEFLYREYY